MKVLWHNSGDVTLQVVPECFMISMIRANPHRLHNLIGPLGDYSTKVPVRRTPPFAGPFEGPLAPGPLKAQEGTQSSEKLLQEKVNIGGLIVDPSWVS